MSCAWRTSDFLSWTALEISTRVSNPRCTSPNTVPSGQLVYTQPTAHSHASCHDVLSTSERRELALTVCKNAIWRTGIRTRVRALVVAVDVTDKSSSDYVIGRGGERWWGTNLPYNMQSAVFDNSTYSIWDWVTVIFSCWNVVGTWSSDSFSDCQITVRARLPLSKQAVAMNSVNEFNSVCFRLRQQYTHLLAAA